MTLATYVQVYCRRGSPVVRTFAFIDPAPLPLPLPLKMGRSLDCHICFDGESGASVSRYHAELQMSAGDVVVRDNGSFNGTYLLSPSSQTAQRISSYTISHGSQVQIQLGPEGPICDIAVGIAVPFGPYFLTAKLGEGGMAEIYVGWDNRLDRFVVLKLLHPDFRKIDPQAGQKLLDEARIVARLEHNNVVRIYELGELGGVPYIAMEYLRGISLGQLNEQLYAQGKGLPPALASAIMRQACLGLHAAHELPTRVVHRDISHNNIIITRDSVKVIDFGIARADNRAGQKTRDGDTKGCPPYMSPEQVASPEKVTRLSDIFSTAVVLYELCTGSPLFGRDTPLATMYAVMNHEPPPLRSVCPRVSEPLERLLQGALVKNPSERLPTTAAEFAALLKEEVSPYLLHHENLVGELEQLGFTLHSSPPSPLAEEPEICRTARLQIRRAAPPAPNLPSIPKPAPRNAAPPASPVEPQDPVDAALLEQDKGWLQVDAPFEMAVGQAHVVRVTIARGRLQRQLSQQGTDIAETLVLDRLLRMELRSDEPQAFTIRPLSPAEQPVLQSDLTPWDWLVIPQKPGTKQILKFVATNFVVGSKDSGSKSHPIKEIAVSVRAQTGYGGIIGLPAAILRWLLDKALATDASLDAFCAEHFPEVHQRFDSSLTRTEKANLLLYLGQGARIVEKLRARDAQTVAEAEARVRTFLTPDLDSTGRDSLLIVELPAKSGSFELSSSRIGRLSITSQELHPREHRHPLALPLPLEGLVSGCRYPLVVLLANRLLELRVAPETLKAGRSVRIYPSELTADGARNSYAVPLPCAGKNLFIGHHRGEHHLITIASSLAMQSESAPPPLQVEDLGVRLVTPEGIERLFALYFIDTQRSIGHLACFSVRSE